jgi:hypothetical protein
MDKIEVTLRDLVVLRKEGAEIKAKCEKLAAEVKQFLKERNIEEWAGEEYKTSLRKSFKREIDNKFVLDKLTADQVKDLIKVGIASFEVKGFDEYIKNTAPNLSPHLYIKEKLSSESVIVNKIEEKVKETRTK